MKPRVAILLLGLSISPAITLLKGSAIMSLVRLYSRLRGLSLSSILALKSTGTLSNPMFNITAVAVNFLLSTILHVSISWFQYLVMSEGVSTGSGISINFFTAAWVTLQGLPNLCFSPSKCPHKTYWQGHLNQYNP